MESRGKSLTPALQYAVEVACSFQYAVDLRNPSARRAQDFLWVCIGRLFYYAAASRTARSAYLLLWVGKDET